MNGTPWSRGMALVFEPLYSEFEFPVCSLIFYLFFVNFNTFWGSGGALGVRIPAGNGYRPRPTSFMRPLYSYSAPKVVYTLFKRTCGNLRKLVKIIYFCCFPILKWGKKYQNSIFLIFPRSNQKMLISLV